MNWELQDVQPGFRKVRGTRDQIANICWIIEKAREFQKNTYFCFIDYAKAFDCVDHNKVWKIFKEMEMPEQLRFPDSSVGKEFTYNAEDPDSIPELGRSTAEGTGYPLQYNWVSLVAQLVKN